MAAYQITKQSLKSIRGEESNAQELQYQKATAESCTFINEEVRKRSA